MDTKCFMSYCTSVQNVIMTVLERLLSSVKQPSTANLRTSESTMTRCRLCGCSFHHRCRRQNSSRPHSYRAAAPLGIDSTNLRKQGLKSEADLKIDLSIVSARPAHGTKAAETPDRK